jgi:hypothetical protein
MWNLSQQKFHISFGALLREAKNGDKIQLVDKRYVFVFMDGNLLRQQVDDLGEVFASL